MRRFWCVFVVFYAFAFLANPAIAITDDAEVNISIPALSEFNAGVDVTLTAVVDDLNNSYMFAQDASTMLVNDNAPGWTLHVELDAAYTDYTLWVEDTQASGNATGTGFIQITTTPTQAELTSFAGYGAAGDHSYDLDWLVTGLSWTSYQGDQTQTVTFTHTT